MSGNSPNSGLIVVIGGGFGGLTTALSLVRHRPNTSVVLIEPRSKFVFLPLLYELLSGELKRWEVAPSYSSLLKGKGIVLVEEYVEKIDINKKQVFTSLNKIINYHKLVIATGSKPDALGVPGVFENALMFNQLNDVEILKGLISRMNSSCDNRKTIIIVGAGATGVELACKISDLLSEDITINLIEIGDRVLPKSHSFNQEQAEQALNKRRIKILLRTRVLRVNRDNVQIQNVAQSDSQNVSLGYAGLIWTAGVKPTVPLGIASEFFSEERLVIDSSLRVKGAEDVFAIGDIACDLNSLSMGTAQLAMQHGEVAAQNIIALCEKRPLNHFEYVDRGEMLSLGIGKATITGLGITISGPLAFRLRRLAYLSKMPSLSLGIRSAGSWFLPLDGKKAF